MRSWLFVLVAILLFSVAAEGETIQERSVSQQTIKPLIADKDHEVVVVNACDLAIWYPKQMFVPLRLFWDDTGGSYFLNVSPLRSF